MTLYYVNNSLIMVVKFFLIKRKIVLVAILLFCYFSVSATNYYVNDGSTTGDTYTSAVGDNANNGTSPSTPKRKLGNLLATYSGVLTAGDKIYIDAGTYTNDHQYTLPSTHPGLSFIGAGYDLTIFDNTGGGTSTDFFMCVLASNTTFSKMSFTGFENNGTQTPGFSGQAITVQGTSGAPITGVLFENVSYLQ